MRFPVWVPGPTPGLIVFVMNGRTYERASQVVTEAENGNPVAQEAVQEMDRTGKVRPAYNKITIPLCSVSRSASRAVIERPEDPEGKPGGLTCRRDRAYDGGQPKAPPHRVNGRGHGSEVEPLGAPGNLAKANGRLPRQELPSRSRTERGTSHGDSHAPRPSTAPTRADYRVRTMTPALTFLHGDAERSYTEHPTAVKESVDPAFADQMRRFARSFPDRGPREAI